MKLKKNSFENLNSIADNVAFLDTNQIFTNMSKICDSTSPLEIITSTPNEGHLFDAEVSIQNFKAEVFFMLFRMKYARKLTASYLILSHNIIFKTVSICLH